ncbi:MAG: zinc ribbon domain-containing protein [Bacteroidales bacterium]|nr:zinc ribbon domain-containing protein [Bacteroidales bacterium]MCF8326755.1 zinc ribbon domain-containing protein [Bacteroidales bacterium]
MITCENCGVKLEKHMNYCPLCGHPASTIESDNEEHFSDNKAKTKKKRLSDYLMLSNLQKRKLLWEISTIILMSALIVTIIIDLLFNSQITWSKYSTTVILVLFANITLIWYKPRNLYVLSGGSLLSTVILLFLLDYYQGSLSWSLNLGIPLLVAVYVLGIALFVIIRKLNDKGLNMIAYILLAAAILSVLTELFISLNRTGEWSLHWSLIVLASVLPASLLLFFIHYRLKKGTELKRFFHI